MDNVGEPAATDPGTRLQEGDSQAFVGY